MTKENENKNMTKEEENKKMMTKEAESKRKMTKEGNKNEDDEGGVGIEGEAGRGT